MRKRQTVSLDEKKPILSKLTINLTSFNKNVRVWQNPAQTKYKKKFINLEGNICNICNRERANVPDIYRVSTNQEEKNDNSKEKWTQCMNRQFSGMDMQMALNIWKNAQAHS